MSTAEVYTFRRLFWIALFITALRIIYLFVNHRDLDIDETQYWSWSQHLALGYHSKPPMISWVIYFSSWLFGNSESAIRIFTPLTYFFSTLLIYGCGKQLYNSTIGFWSGVSVLLLPGAAYSSTIISTDPLLILFWCMALYAFINALQSRKIGWWIICGLAIGLGLLSKYTMLVFFLGAILYFICSREHSSALKKTWPLLSIDISYFYFYTKCNF
jgi:4-amino-4-deoxy-L-arabinose transferase-like glycosyltransferase